MADSMLVWSTISSPTVLLFDVWDGILTFVRLLRLVLERADAIFLQFMQILSLFIITSSPLAVDSRPASILVVARATRCVPRRLDAICFVSL
jgi:hypothetical protein